VQDRLEPGRVTNIDAQAHAAHSATRWRRGSWVRAARYLVEVALIAGAYYGFSRLGSALQLTGGVGAFWPATGFGIAVLYLGGLRWWPGLLIGDALANLGTSGTGVALAVSAGDIVRAVVAAVILLRLIGPRARMDRLSHVGAVVIAVGTGAAIAATVATVALGAAGVIVASQIGVVWRSWWLGDVAGGVVVVPLALAWAQPPAREWRGRVLEGVLMLATVGALSAIALSAKQPLTYLVFPGLIWAALRFGPQGATLAVAVAAVQAVVVTANNLGPFHVQAPNDTALNLQLYIIVAALITLCLTVITSERRRGALELRASRERIVETAERERERLERDLHDGAQAQLVAIQISLEIARDLTQPGSQVEEQIDEAKRDLEAAIEELRDLAHGIYPPALRDLGPAVALQSLAATSSVPVEVIDKGVGRSSDVTEAAIYFCAREAIQNAAKHAGPGAKATVTLGRGDHGIELTVSDDGVGMPSERDGDGMGITSMRDRIEAVGGELDIRSAPRLGTSIHAKVPDCRPE
jgi:signal transduction histidine kinase